ncbi:MAG TPA: hypothetical protein PKH98_05685, partial [Candidatus Omnitrophota bacterium]|nr:hypothetical protein [Candidatus Omnitrophota bacterium]
EDDKIKKTIWETGADVIGPLYTSFVWWILKNAEKHKIKRLYFMSRDGHILYKIAELFKEAWELDVDLRYFNISRQSIFYPSIIDVDTMDAKWFTWNIFSDLTPEIVLNRLSIKEEEVSDELLKYGVKNIHHRMPFSKKTSFLKFFHEPKVKEIILKKSDQLNENTIGYLKQEGFADQIPYAVVDLGWLALSQYALSRLLDKNNCRPKEGVKGFYLGLNGLFSAYKNDTGHAYMFSPKNYLFKINLIQYELLEIFCSTRQGRTINYKKDNGKFYPILSCSDIDKDWPIEAQIESVLHFTRNLLLTLPLLYKEYTPSDHIAHVFHLFCNYPSKNEADVYGRFLHGADIEEKKKVEISPQISMKEILKILRGYYWVQGSITRSNFIFRPILIILFTIINMLRHEILRLSFRIIFKIKRKT